MLAHWVESKPLSRGDPAVEPFGRIRQEKGVPKAQRNADDAPGEPQRLALTGKMSCLLED
jgi:hypothetical protein